MKALRLSCCWWRLGLGIDGTLEWRSAGLDGAAHPARCPRESRGLGGDAPHVLLRQDDMPHPRILQRPLGVDLECRNG